MIFQNRSKANYLLSLSQAVLTDVPLTFTSVASHIVEHII